MASYFLLVKTFSRGKGSSATKAAAYRAGERIRDERSGAVHDYTDRPDVVQAEIVLPAEQAGAPDMEWARNRSVLWNAVQQSGRLWNSRLAREVLVLLPPELTAAQRCALTRGFSQELANRYRSAVDFAVHQPRAQADARHHHAHILMTCRQVGPDGVGARTTLELSGTERHQRGLNPSKDELLWMRERWAQVTNQALRDAGLDVRVDHRSYRAQGIDREPKPSIPQSVFYQERLSGEHNPAGDQIRNRYRERVEARAQGGEALARVVERQRREGRQQALQSSERKTGEKLIPTGAMTREQLNEKRRAYCKANSEEINRKQRERRRANKDEVNRKQREYAEKRRAERDAAMRAASPTPRIVTTEGRSLRGARGPPITAPAGLAAPIPAPAPSTPVTAEGSVKNWLAYRQAQTSPSSQESLKEWLTYRDQESAAAAPPRRGSRDRSPSAARGDEPSSPAKSERKNDLAL